MPPNEENKKSGVPDPSSFLLPKKPTPGKTTDSAQRVNAGALLEQEQNATLPKPPPAPLKPAPPPVKSEEPIIPPLQTYKGDIESLIETTNASTVSIAAAEAARRSQAPVETVPPTDWSGLLKRTGMVLAGLLLITGAGGALYLTYQRLNTTATIPPPLPAPFIAVDRTTPLTLPAGELQRSTLMDTLVAAKTGGTLSLGLIERFTLYQPSGETFTEITTSTGLPALAPNMPAELVRTLTGRYLVGSHSYDGTQAFLLFETDSYERAFAGLLQWERTMRGDLLPLFDREPRPRLPEEGVATSSVGSVPQLLQTGFSDRIIDNRDTRVIANTSGDILLLWAPLGPNLFLITTNEYTLREIVSRLGL